MDNLSPDKPCIPRPAAARRRAVSVSPESLVRTRPLGERLCTPLVVEPSVEGVSLSVWAATGRAFVEELLPRHGGLLFRDFEVRDVTEFEQFVGAVAGTLMDYAYQSTPRTQVSGNVYTSTEYPAAQSIPLHNEMSYARRWPMKICFCCLQPAARGGATPVADSRKVLARIDPSVRKQFARRGVMYVRNYGGGVDLPWAKVFQTDSRAEVEAYCLRAGIEFEWLAGDRLRTRQVCPAIAEHPRTGEAVWFNQAHLFHVSNLKPEVLASLLSTFGEDELPRNAYYGDGQSIEADVLEHIREAYRQETVIFEWRAGDVLLLDNMLVAHGREPFEGARKVVVGMAQPSDGAAA